MGRYVNLSQSEVEDFDIDGNVQPSFRSPVLTVNSSTAMGTITYAYLAAEPNYKPHLVDFVSSAFGFLLFWRLGEGKWLKTEEVYCWQYILSALRHAWDQSSPQAAPNLGSEI